LIASVVPLSIFLKLFSSIQENLIALAKEKIGSPMLYDLIEVRRMASFGRTF
jgi:hypothetical protein